MGHKILFSFIVPNLGYNEKSFKRCILSLVNQAKNNDFAYEILICDQSDVVDSNKVSLFINSLKCPYIKVAKSNIHSAFYARQLLMSQALGDYLVCVDSDDWVDKDYLCSAYEFIKSNNYPDIILLPYDNYKNGKFTSTIYPHKFSSKKKYQDVLLYTNKLNSTCNKILKRELFRTQNCSKKINEDKVLLIPFFSNANTISVYKKKAFYHYDFNENSLTHNLTVEKVIESIEQDSIYWKPSQMNKKQIKLFINSSFTNLSRSMQMISINKTANSDILDSLYAKELNYLKKYDHNIFRNLNFKNKIKYLLYKIVGIKCSSSRTINKIVYATPFLIMSIFAIFPNFILNNTLNYKLDRFSYSLRNYNNASIQDDMKSPMINIKRKDSSDLYFKDLYDEFWYSNITSSIRQQISDECTISYNGTSSHPLKIQYQPTYSTSTTKNKSGSYNIDGNLATAYYAPGEVLSKDEYLKIRFGCDTFMFVSDTMADKLLMEKGLPKGDYKSLINNENYSKLNISTNKGNTINACINNVVHSTENYFQKRLSNIYGDFAFIYIPSHMSKKFNYEFEVDFKDSPFAIKEVVRKISNYGYFNNNKYGISINSFNSKTNTFVLNETATKQLNLINFKLKDVGLYVAFSFTGLIGIALFVVSLKVLRTNNKWNLIMILFNVAIIIVLSIMFNFVYFYNLWSIVLLMLMFSYFIFNRKEVKKCFLIQLHRFKKIK